MGRPPYTGPIWPCSLLPVRLEMRPRGLVCRNPNPRPLGEGEGICAGPAWPCFDCGGLITSGQERQTFNSLPFPSISTHFLSSTRGWDARFSSARERDARFSSARERRREPLLHTDGEPSPAWNGPQECAGVAKLLISAHFLSFPLIPLVDAGGGRLGLRLGLHPHPCLLPSREKGPEPSRERRDAFA